MADLDDHFHALWMRSLNASSLSALTPDLLRTWAKERGLNPSHVEERDIGLFGKTPAIVLAIGDVKACFPKIPANGDTNWENQRQAAEVQAAQWEKMEWFCPLWIPMGKLQKILSDAAGRSREEALKLFNYNMSTLWTIPFEAVCIAQILPQARSLKEFCALAREAFLAFYSGYRASGISALIPIIEGSLIRITSDAEDSLPISARVDRVIDRAIEAAARLHYEQMWVPREYMGSAYLFGQDERVFMFETFRRWLQKSFFQKTGAYDGITRLNRHMFAHGTDASWQQSANFGRLIVALATLALIESWHDETHAVSLFFPKMNEDSKLLWQQALYRSNMQMRFHMSEQRRYQKHGRLVPEMPTDDGVLLRKAILSDDCIRDLVRPLRDAGWVVEVGEPDEHALYIKILATSDEKNFGAALLYSCATGNEIYRELAGTCEAILYRGAPYHQQQYAYGIKVHVGPVTGWLPLLAPNQRYARRLRWRRVERLRAQLALMGKFMKYAWAARHKTF